jgi:hypothetical protein
MLVLPRSHHKVLKKVLYFDYSLLQACGLQYYRVDNLIPFIFVGPGISKKSQESLIVIFPKRTAEYR